MKRLASPVWAVVAALGLCSVTHSVLADEFEKPPINYSKATPDNPVSRLEAKLAQGDVKFTYDDKVGYLRSLLSALEVPISSQVFVYSKTSLQRHKIAPETPRAVYFNDESYVGFCQDGDVLELSVADPQLGTVFYSVDQYNRATPTFLRQTDNCLLCHGSSSTEGVPGHLVRSVFPDRGGQPILSSGSYRIDHTSPLKNRWGGWYVTGTHGEQTHMGNLIFRQPEVREPIAQTEGLNVTSLTGLVKTTPYLSAHSDLVALMVLEHQAQGHNLLARASIETRLALHQEAMLNRELKEAPDHRWNSTSVRIRSAGDALVKYLLFSEEAELTQPVKGTSTFAAEFAKRGPFDKRGRSLREFDLSRRMFKYPCSYLIYTPSFDALPREMLEYVYNRLWQVLAGGDTTRDFAHLTAADRTAIIEIIRATKSNLPASWQQAE
ncbi:MAG: hypothetical protein JNM18_03955 [Planctomycetaceae bacterium]|nr:hypothetical protein [Planctomycetaceae bacterium]